MHTDTSKLSTWRTQRTQRTVREENGAEPSTTKPPILLCVLCVLPVEAFLRDL
jgi:hypothetical protein